MFIFERREGDGERGDKGRGGAPGKGDRRTREEVGVRDREEERMGRRRMRKEEMSLCWNLGYRSLLGVQCHRLPERSVRVNCDYPLLLQSASAQSTMPSPSSSFESAHSVS